MATTTRRDALKYIGLGFGGVAIAPSFLLQACREAASNPTYTYASFTAPQATALRLIQDMILPKTESSPSASEVGSVQFADTYVNMAENIIIEGDRAVIECRGSVTTKKGEPYNNSYCWVCRLRDGKLVEIVEYMDTALAEAVLERPARALSA